MFLWINRTNFFYVLIISKINKKYKKESDNMAVYKGTPTKDGRQYFFRIKYKDIFNNTKDYKSKKYLTRKEAIKEEANFRTNNLSQKKSIANYTIDDIFKEYIEEHSKEIKPQTKLKILSRYNLLEPIKDIKIESFDLTKYRQLKLHLENAKYDGNKYSVDYLNKVLGILRNIIKYSAKYYNTSDNILKYIDNFKSINIYKKEMDFYTYEEFQKFIRVIDELEYKTFFEILYFLGLRQGELTALTWNDINFSKKELRINKTLTTKLKGELYTISTPKTKNSYRTLPIPKNVLNDLKIMYNNTSNMKYFKKEWFIFGNELPFKESTICSKKNKYCKLANLKQIRIHDFRHSCASFLINNGASIVLVSKYLGHSKISITLDTYTHFYKNELNEITNIIDNF